MKRDKVLRLMQSAITDDLPDMENINLNDVLAGMEHVLIVMEEAGVTKRADEEGEFSEYRNDATGYSFEEDNGFYDD